jgi:hypothetical protein
MGGCMEDAKAHLGEYANRYASKERQFEKMQVRPNHSTAAELGTAKWCACVRVNACVRKGCVCVCVCVCASVCARA